MSKKFFSGNSVEQAVLSAARHFEIDPQEVAYSEVERRHGFLRVRRRAVISVDPEHPRKTGETGPSQDAPDASDQLGFAPPVAAPEPPPPFEDPSETAAVEPSHPSHAADAETEREYPDLSKTDQFWPEDEMAEPAPASSASSVSDRGGSMPPLVVSTPELKDEIEAAEEALRRLFVLADLNLTAEVTHGEERLEIELGGEDEERLLEDRGRLLLAIQHLLPRMLRGLVGRSVPCWVDCDNFHEIRAEQLRDLAQRVASQVRREREMQTLDPMSPDERRIVHITLSDDPAVETVSRGQGLFKRVQIRPVRARPQGFDPYPR